MRNVNLLIVDDELGIRHGLSQFFKKEGFSVYTAEDQASMEAVVREFHVDIILLDLRLKNGQSGLDALSWLRSAEADIPIIIITGYGSIDSAVQAIKLGAVDYILKPLENHTILELVKKNLEVKDLRKTNVFLRNELLSSVYTHQIITENPVFQSLIKRIDTIKNTTATILLTGESGTGKEVVARYAHFTSNRGEGPFVSINCAALSETLLLSELFGHEKGAFTGAVERHIGKFELADKGTLFLDEIGDMSPSVQAKLLRVLEENAFERVGGTKRITIDIRLVAATNKDLKELIQKGEFRSDLYYRIAVMEIQLPPLRHRREDIPALVNHFVAQFSKKYHKQIRAVSPKIVEYWKRYEWPGNIRELQNAVNQAVLLCPDDVIDEGVIPVMNKILPELELESLRGDAIDIDRYSTLESLQAAVLAYYEKKLIGRSLEENGFNHSKTAKALGITRKTLAIKMKRYNL